VVRRGVGGFLYDSSFYHTHLFSFLFSFNINGFYLQTQIIFCEHTIAPFPVPCNSSSLGSMCDLHSFFTLYDYYFL
jgi:hypothetical protein